MVVGTKPMDRRGSFPIPQSVCPASLLTLLCSIASICHHSLLRGHHGSRGRCRRGGPRGQFLGGEQLGSRFGGWHRNAHPPLGLATCPGKLYSCQPQPLRGHLPGHTVLFIYAPGRQLQADSAAGGRRASAVRGPGHLLPGTCPHREGLRPAAG